MRRTCDGETPSVMCPGPKVEDEILSHVEQCGPIFYADCLPSAGGEPEIPNLEEWDFLAWYTQKTLQLIDYASSYEDIINTIRPVYKQTKYAFGTGGLEAIADGAIYGLKDRWSTSLSPGQRVGRVTVVGAQSFLVDRLSDKVGLLGAPLGKPGEVAVQYIFSAAVSEFVLPTTTYKIFDGLNLGVPLDIGPMK